MPSGKRLVHFVSGRHNDDRLRNAQGVFLKVFDIWSIFTDLYRILTEIADVH